MTCQYHRSVKSGSLALILFVCAAVPRCCCCDASSNRNLRGFVRSLMIDEGLPNLAEGGRQEIARWVELCVGSNIKQCFDLCGMHDNEKELKFCSVYMASTSCFGIYVQLKLAVFVCMVVWFNLRAVLQVSFVFWYLCCVRRQFTIDNIINGITKIGPI